MTTVIKLTHEANLKRKK